MNRTSEVTFGDDNSVLPVLRTLTAGDSVIYHRGNLASDREPRPSGLNPVRHIASEAWYLYCQGHVLLTQRKIASIDKNVYEYIATGTTPPYKKVIFTGGNKR